MTLRLMLLVLAVVAPGRGEPRLDLNSATRAQLESVSGVGPTTAARIVRVRERNGPYRCVEELRAVPRLRQAQFQALRDRTFVRNADPRCAQQESARRAGRPVG